MVNKRMMAVAAVLVLAVPAFGAAATIYVPNPTPEQLVEGHTVFTVIQVAINTTTTQARFAAAVAVLVRESTANQNTFRFPGVLWFNDQYLVNPTEPASSQQSYRYPCGGAVLAVNQNDPDPRLLLANINGQTVSPYGSQGTAPFDFVGGQGNGTENATVGIDTSGTPPALPNVFTDATVGVLAGADYKESYLITDPNDHTWIIDRYDGYTRYGTGGAGTSIYNYPVWAVNMQGLAAFIPDDGTLSCMPYVDDAVSTVYTAAGVSGGIPGWPSAVTQNTSISNPPYPSNATNQVSCHYGLGTSANMPAQDTPCAGYNDPAGGYCYQGKATSTTPCSDKSVYPTRLYNALLYFKLEDLKVAGNPITHDGANTDTNGCAADTTEWSCPNGDDNAEGNSHPFNPYGNSATAPSSAPWTSMACPAGFAGTNPVNHGGSAAQDAGQPALCDHVHATREIDLYFDATSRPLTPVARHFDVTDTEGSTAPFAGTGDGSVPPPSNV